MSGLDVKWCIDRLVALVVMQVVRLGHVHHNRYGNVHM